MSPQGQGHRAAVASCVSDPQQIHHHDTQHVIHLEPALPAEGLQVAQQKYSASLLLSEVQLMLQSLSADAFFSVRCTRREGKPTAANNTANSSCKS
jgi:hypothetical protein